MPFIHDHAQMFSASAVAAVGRQIAAARSQTGEELVVVTVPSVPGAEIDDAVGAEAQRIFAQQGVRGALLYVDRDDHRDALIAQPQSWFAAGEVPSLRRSLDARFALGEYDAGLEDLATAVLDIYRSHARPAPPSAIAPAPRLRVAAVIAAVVLAYLVILGASRREGG